VILISDIEANGFYNTVTKVHCIVSQDYDSLELFISPHDFCSGLGTVISYEDHRKLHEKASKTVYHNGLMYDYPVLNKVLGWPVPKLSKVDDTFIQSSLFNPDIATPKGCTKGAHSLEAWGLRMSYEKGEVDSFSEYTLPMLEYCIRDVEITTKLYRKMQAIRDKHDWELSLKIEYTMASLQAEQERQGVVLDEEKAYDLVESLTEEIVEIEGKILPNVPAKPRQWGTTITEPFKLDGDYKNTVKNWYGVEL
jgi:DNA polymerase I-like protein with 3'-5' exonuclease and polymerase domains